jgi:nitrite reductase/ring-hydroxylating ferredoxin subunit
VVSIRALMIDELGFDPDVDPNAEAARARSLLATVVAVAGQPSPLAGALRASALLPLPAISTDAPTPAEVAATLAAGEVAPALRGAEPVAVIRTESGRLYVLPDRCPHDGGPISDGYVEGEAIVCARHGWQLDACSGQRRCPARG